MKTNILADYYITETINNSFTEGCKAVWGADFKITDKIRVSVILSSDKMEGDFDIFIKKSHITKEPTKNDLIFFEKTFSFFSVVDCQDSADYYLLNVTPYKLYKNER